jgi:hypothetical protein
LISFLNKNLGINFSFKPYIIHYIILFMIRTIVDGAGRGATTSRADAVEPSPALKLDCFKSVW